MQNLVEYYFEKAAEQARLATCHRAKCGAVVVAKTGEILGEGFNAPPLNDEEQRMCDKELDLALKPKYDKTCCIHAEWNAIIEALKNMALKLMVGHYTLYVLMKMAIGQMLENLFARFVAAWLFKVGWDFLHYGLMENPKYMI